MQKEETNLQDRKDASKFLKDRKNALSPPIKEPYQTTVAQKIKTRDVPH